MIQGNGGEMIKCCLMGMEENRQDDRAPGPQPQQPYPYHKLCYVTWQRGLGVKIELRLVTRDLGLEAAWMAQ